MISDVKAIDLGKYLERVPQNRIRRVGVELEGGWVRVPRGEDLVVDMSVLKKPTEFDKEAIKRLKINKIGELPSPRLVPRQVEGWIRKSYPDYVNQTCGLHVHMSFFDLRHYADLICPEYQQTIILYMKDWAVREKLSESHPIWPRLAGTNEFCNHNYFGDKQLRDTRKDYDHFRPGNRYTAVAYRFGTHKTIECRLLPMFETPEQSVRAVRHILDITNACLVKIAKKKRRDVEIISGPPLAEGVIERDIEELEEDR